MRSVGIHVDSRKIRILDIDISSKKLALHGLFEMDRGSGESLSEILKSYFAGTTRPERVVASVGSVPVVVRTFQLPFRDRSQVQQAIFGEFEDTLPIDIEQFVLEFQQLEREGSVYNFLGAIISREPLEDMSRVFETIDVVPSDFLIPSEALGRLGLSLLSGEFQPGTVVCFCDIGFEATQVAVAEFPKDPGAKFKPAAYTSSLVDFRHISRGSKDIYDREGNKLNLSVAEFEGWLATRANFAGLGMDDLKNAVRPLLVELYQVTQAAMSKSGHKVAHFVLTGGLSQCAGFREFFETELRTPTLIWDPFQTIDISKSPVGPDVSSRFIIPLGLALRHGALRTLPWLNFRRSSRRKQVISAALEQLSQPEFRAQIFPLAFMSLAIFMISMIASFMMNTRVEKQATRTASAIQRTRAPLSPTAAKLMDDVDDMTEKFEAFKVKKLATLPSQRAGGAALEDLAKLSQAMPGTVRVQELSLTSNSQGKSIQATLNADKNPTIAGTELQSALQAQGFTDATITGDGSIRTLKMKGK